jgi:hypothetical protein
MRLANRCPPVPYVLSCLLGLLVGSAAGAAEHIESDWLAQDALRAVLLAMPEDSDRALHLYEIHIYAQPETTGLLLCGKVEFANVEAGRISFALFYEADSGRPRRNSAPFFYGLYHLRGTVEPADRCAEAEENARAAQWHLHD